MPILYWRMINVYSSRGTAVSATISLANSNISCNLKAAYESECKEVVKAFEKSILLHVIDEAWKIVLPA